VIYWVGGGWGGGFLFIFSSSRSIFTYVKKSRYSGRGVWGADFAIPFPPRIWGSSCALCWENAFGFALKLCPEGGAVWVCFPFEVGLLITGWCLLVVGFLTLFFFWAALPHLTGRHSIACCELKPHFTYAFRGVCRITLKVPSPGGRAWV